jgi:hypothetical protein
VKKNYFLLLIIVLSFNAAVLAQTNRLTLSGTSPGAFYLEQVSSHNVFTGKIKILRNDVNGNRDYTIAAAPVSTARQAWKYNNTQVTKPVRQANLYTTSNTNNADNIAKTWGIEPNLAASNVWTGSMGPKVDEIEITYYLLFQDWTDNPPPYGTYQLDVEFKLWQTSFSNNSSPPSGVTPYVLPITLTVVVGPYIYVSFADINGLPINSIALDETSTKTIDFKVLAKANMPYDVTVSSNNGGTLNLNTGSSIEKINYRLWIIDMTTAINFQQTPVKTVLSNQDTMGHGVPPVSHNARIQVLFDSTANYTAGKYSDTLQLEIKSHW